MQTGDHELYLVFVKWVWEHTVARKDHRAFHQILQLACPVNSRLVGFSPAIDRSLVARFTGRMSDASSSPCSTSALASSRQRKLGKSLCLYLPDSR